MNNGDWLNKLGDKYIECISYFESLKPIRSTRIVIKVQKEKWYLGFQKLSGGWTITLTDYEDLITRSIFELGTDLRLKIVEFLPELEREIIVTAKMTETDIILAIDKLEAYLVKKSR